MIRAGFGLQIFKTRMSLTMNWADLNQSQSLEIFLLHCALFLYHVYSILAGVQCWWRKMGCFITFNNKWSSCKLLTKPEATYNLKVFTQNNHITIYFFFFSLLCSFMCLFICFSLAFCCLVMFAFNVIADTQRRAEIPFMPLVHSSPLSTLYNPFVSYVLFNCVPWNCVIRFHKRRKEWAQCGGVKRRKRLQRKKGAALARCSAKLPKNTKSLNCFLLLLLRCYSK